MAKINKKISARQKKQQLKRHKRSMVIVTCVLMLLGGVVSVSSISLQAKNKTYKAQEEELRRQIKEEEERLEDIKELEEYVQTDEYIEDKAKEELGLARKNEILFQIKKNLSYFLSPSKRNRYKNKLIKSRYKVIAPIKAIFCVVSFTSISSAVSNCLIFCES